MSFINPKPGSYAFGEKLPSGHVNTIWSNVSKAVDGIGGGTYTLTANLVFDDATHFISVKAGLVPAGGNFEIFGILGVFSGGVLGFDSGASASFTTGSVLHFDSGSTLTGTASVASGCVVDVLGGGELRFESSSQLNLKSGSATNFLSGAQTVWASGSLPSIQTPLNVEKLGAGAASVTFKKTTSLAMQAGSSIDIAAKSGADAAVSVTLEAGSAAVDGGKIINQGLIQTIGTGIAARTVIAGFDGNRDYNFTNWAEHILVATLTGASTYGFSVSTAVLGQIIHISLGTTAGGPAANLDIKNGLVSGGGPVLLTLDNAANGYYWVEIIFTGSAWEQLRAGIRT